jgi:protein SCO1/2
MPKTTNPIAGQAYVQKEDGTLVPATMDNTGGRSSAPVRPAGSEEQWLKKFELMERSGQILDSETLKGQPYVVGFFFTTCPTICVRQNAKVAQLQQLFRGQPIRLLSITCDPEVDVPEVLSIYADGLRADKQQWLFLTGDLSYLRRVGSEMYSLPVDRRFHAEKLILVDADGDIYGSYAWPNDTQWQTLIDDIQAMLKAGGRLPKNDTPSVDFRQTPIDPDSNAADLNDSDNRD